RLPAGDGPPQLAAQRARRRAGRRGGRSDPPARVGRRGLRQPRPQPRHHRGGRRHRRGLRRGGIVLSISMSALVPMPVVLPLLGAGLTLVFSRRPRTQRFVTIGVLSAVVVIAAVLLVASDREGPQVV